MPSCAATDVASELASCVMTSLSGVPPSSFALTARVSATAAGEAAIVVDGAALPLAVERAASESPSCVLNSAPSIPAAGVVACAPECAPVEALVLMVVIAFRVSPPLGRMIEPTSDRAVSFFYRSPPGET
jgi:hypothetical protein